VCRNDGPNHLRACRDLIWHPSRPRQQLIVEVPLKLVSCRGPTGRGSPTRELGSTASSGLLQRVSFNFPAHYVIKARLSRSRVIAVRFNDAFGHGLDRLTCGSNIRWRRRRLRPDPVRTSSHWSEWLERKRQSC
jgi:hypothetical protein